MARSGRRSRAGGPCDGALNGAVIPEPLSSGSTGHPPTARHSGNALDSTRVCHSRRMTLEQRHRRHGSIRQSSTVHRARRCRASGSPAGLEPKRTIQPDGADGRHMGAAVLVERREPRRASVMRVWSGGGTRVQLLDDARPVNGR